MKTYLNTEKFLSKYLIHRDYFDFFNDDLIDKINNFFEKLDIENIEYTPRTEQIFRAFSKSIFEQKICIIGKDPYFQKNVANGLAFSVNIDSWSSKNINTSLLNILKLIYKTYTGKLENIDTIRKNIYTNQFKILNPQQLFTYYNENGILLINSSLTTIIGTPGAHHNFWYDIVKDLLIYINNKNKDIFYIIWGNDAKKIFDEIEQNSFMGNNNVFKNKIIHNHPSRAGNLNNEKDFLNGNCFELTKHLIDYTGSKLLDEYNKLDELIKYHNDLYYNQNTNEISDKEYDILSKKLKKLNDLYNFNNVTITKIGGTTNSNFEKISHKTKMLSLDNTYSYDDLLNFNNRVKKQLNTDDEIEYVIELKIDGLSISLIYENGVLEKAITRGDGKIGENVIDNVKMIKSIPQKLNKNISIEVRGEIVLPNKEFTRINLIREKNNEELFANPRNVASGTIRQLDPNVVKERNLDCYLYYIINPEKYNLNTQKDAINYLNELGFKTTNICEKINNFEKVKEIITKWDKERFNLDYMIDGLVIKVNNFKYYDILSSTIKTPRWAISYKFETEKAITKLKDVIFQVGKTGVITPVAVLEPTFLSGSTVKRASLHNFEDMYKKQIMINDDVLIEKAAEIIPQVIKPIIENRDNTQIEIKMPTNCPSCNSLLVKDDEKLSLKCINKDCPDKFIQNLQYFVSKNAMNILNLGEAQLKTFVNEGFIKKIYDIYNLKNYRNEILNLHGYKETMTDKILESIEESKKNNFDRLLIALSIPNVSVGTVPELLKYYKDIDSLINAKYEELLNINGIGSETAKNIVEFFEDKNNIEIINKFKEYGLNLKIIDNINININQELLNRLDKNLNLFNIPIITDITNKSFIVSGKLKNFKKEEIKELITYFGGIYSTSVNKNLDYLISDSDTSTKIEKAKKLGITILSEDDLINILNYLKNINKKDAK